MQSNRNTRLKEPIDHVIAASALIRKVIGPDCIIVNFSYKEYALLDAMIALGYQVSRQQWEKQSIEMGRDSQANWINGIAEEIKSWQKKGSVLLLIAKALEHAFDIKMLDLILGNKGSPTYIYTELSDFRIRDLRSYSIWNERCNYFSPVTLAYLLQQYGYERVRHCNGSIENGYYALWKKVSPKSTPSSINIDLPTHIDNHRGSFRNIIKDGDYVVKSIADVFIGRKVGIYGSGHKGVGLAQKISSMGVDCTVYDGKGDKVGMICGHGIIRSTNHILHDGLDAIILAMGVKAAISTSSRLRRDGWDRALLR